MSTTASAARHYSRQFLNNEGHHGLAAIHTEVLDGDTSDGFLDFGALVEISDCNRTVSLDFGVFGSTVTPEDIAERRADLENVRAKAERLKAELAAFTAALDEGLAKVEKTLNKHDRKAKKKAAKSAKKKG
jgi:hypothetical protein